MSASIPAANRDNFCYRHPDRQSFVLCQRCGRTICGECQTPAAVGVVCPECMREQRAGMTPAQRRASRGGGASVQRLVRSGRPVVTYTLIGITAVVYLLQWLVPSLTSGLLYAGVYSYPEAFEPWRMLTSVFLHSTGLIFHVLLNMYTLWLFGQALEPLLGRARFLTLYLVSGFAGSLGVMLLSSPQTAVVGASGAIFGLMGAFLVIQRRLGGNTTGLLVLVGINLVIGFVPGFNIAWQAHLGGMIGGALVGLIFYETRKRDQRGLQIGLLVALCVVFVLLSLLRFVVR
ncbi:rhomboid family intramembrane serine protease [Okibacterium endophyticum]